jgi:hypothetical protein
MVLNPLNSSTSKEMHAFSKSSRFPELKSNTKNVAHASFTKLTDFDKTVKKGSGKPEHSFGARHSRFTYYPDTRDCVVGPANYKEMDAFNSRTIYKTSSKFSMGLGRESMQKLHI